MSPTNTSPSSSLGFQTMKKVINEPIIYIYAVGFIHMVNMKCISSINIRYHHFPTGKLLGVPEIDSSSGKDQKNAIIDLLTAYNIEEKVRVRMKIYIYVVAHK